jgi:hypothetical protein
MYITYSEELQMKPKNRSEEIHWNHKIELVKMLTKPKRHTKKSPELKPRFHCRQCDTYVKWPSSDEQKYWRKKKFTDISLHDFLVDFEKYGTKSPTWEPRDTNNAIFIRLSATYKDKDKVKNLGATYYAPDKYWYVFSYNQNLDKLLPWIEEPYLSKLHEHLSLQGNIQPYSPEPESHNLGLYRLQKLWDPK